MAALKNVTYIGATPEVFVPNIGVMATGDTATVEAGFGARLLEQPENFVEKTEKETK